ncbi:TetR/AcrR family transcriptional regulator [Pseudoclavibacter chungangensis]|uniref:TetR/AcrR family transcriptional regulator n=1 Tax=Pseudoclavibacter chungangensis TaxID=587635 RepID=A0A7J5BSZ0_9MICO|nr:TetR/AcrR family transcriptional regulator [Pseudoclavibacter chungangensis]KAB1656302.1 TetR/AcrR family transcriptional regulator [Pseudoclavibacter chungangensis]NYJ67065.1 AcrR family transcriptional regulator [Pseudoclavibacter chungangensis]
MVRTLAFDRDEVVRSALEVFWRDGYAGASLPTLEGATGLSRSSIYNTFGSKRGLFDAAVQNYLDEVVRPRLRPLRSVTVDRAAILDYLDGLRAVFSRAVGPPGCLLVNAAATPLAADGDVARVIIDYRNELHAAIGNGVRAFLADDSAADADRLTDAVTDLVVAAFALVRVAPDVAIHTLATAHELITRERPA